MEDQILKRINSYGIYEHNTSGNRTLINEGYQKIIKSEPGRITDYKDDNIIKKQVDGRINRLEVKNNPLSGKSKGTTLLTDIPRPELSEKQQLPEKRELSDRTVRVANNLLRKDKNLINNSERYINDPLLIRVLLEKIKNNKNNDKVDNASFEDVIKLEAELQKKADGQALSKYAGILQQELQFPIINIQELNGNQEIIIKDRALPNEEEQQNISFMGKFKNLFSAPKVE